MSYLAKMLDLLTSAYCKTDAYNTRNALPMQSNIGRLFAALDWGFGLIEQNAERVRLWNDIDHAQGAALDRHGANVGVARGGANDVFYRLSIRIKILSQISGGDIDTILTAVSGLYEIDADRIELEECFPAKVQIAIYENDLPADYMSIRDLVGILTKRLLAGGIALDMIYKAEDITKSNIRTGGWVVGEHTRVRLAKRIEEIPPLSGQIYCPGNIVSEASRIRLESVK